MKKLLFGLILFLPFSIVNAVNVDADLFNCMNSTGTCAIGITSTATEITISTSGEYNFGDYNIDKRVVVAGNDITIKSNFSTFSKGIEVTGSNVKLYNLKMLNMVGYKDGMALYINNGSADIVGCYIEAAYNTSLMVNGGNSKVTSIIDSTIKGSDKTINSIFENDLKIYSGYISASSGNTPIDIIMNTNAGANLIYGNSLIKSSGDFDIENLHNHVIFTNNILEVTPNLVVDVSNTSEIGDIIVTSSVGNINDYNIFYDNTLVESSNIEVISSNKVIIKNITKTVGTHYITLAYGKYANKDGVIKRTFNVLNDLKDSYITLTTDYTYNGTNIVPEYSVIKDDTPLVLNVDYKVSYENKKNVGEYTIKFKGIGTYAGTINKTYNINKKDVTLTINDMGKIYLDSDPVLTYKLSGLVGEDTLYGINLIRESGENVGTYKISNKTNLNDNTKNKNYNITIKKGNFYIGYKNVFAYIKDIADQIFNGKSVTPKIIAYDGELIIDESEYSVMFTDNNKPGIAKVTLINNEGGNYIVSGLKEFNILPNINPQTGDNIEKYIVYSILSSVGLIIVKKL